MRTVTFKPYTNNNKYQVNSEGGAYWVIVDTSDYDNVKARYSRNNVKQARIDCAILNNQ